ncbi:hypothetical protein EMIT0P74_80282 [Pseudomonas sp. IT-P74]
MALSNSLNVFLASKPSSVLVRRASRACARTEASLNWFASVETVLLSRTSPDGPWGVLWLTAGVSLGVAVNVFAPASAVPLLAAKLIGELTIYCHSLLED